MAKQEREVGEVVLLSLCGMSPAVITETAWALAKGLRSLTPHRVVALTTVSGRECIRRELIDSGAWEGLRTSVKAGGRLRFGDTADSIRLLPRADGHGDADDIASIEDSAKAGDFILETLRQFTENPDTCVIFSIAGGRKTMSALGALAMTLLGREQDRLCHVLVSPPFDSPMLSPKFLYPVPGQVHRLDGNRHPSRQARITLHDIPFPRARDIFQREYRRLPGSFTDTVDLANRALAETQGPPSMRLDPGHCRCELAGEAIVLPPPEFLLVWRLCLGAKRGKGLIVGEDALGKELAAFHQAVVERGRASPLINAWSARPLGGDEYPRKLASRLRASLRKHFGGRPFWSLLDPCRVRGQYGLLLPGSAITIADGDKDVRDVRRRPRAGNGAPPKVKSGKRKKSD